MPAIDINRWITSLLEYLATVRQRQLVVLEGPRDWCDSQLVSLSRQADPVLLLSNRDLLPAAVSFAKAESCLGGETRLVVVDLFDGFNPDVVCIAGGLVQAGGVLLLMSPAGDAWQAGDDRYALWQDDKRSTNPFFADYFFESLRRAAEVGLWLTPQSMADLPGALPTLQATPIDHGHTAEQAAVLQQIEQWLITGREGIALISADRGRGKSTCLGLLLKRLQSRLRILVCANSRKTAIVLLQQAPQAEFVAPDELLRHCPEADLLLIDEAAMIPLSLLRQLSRLYPRLVMATTSGGYEGTGQGFMLRFVAGLEDGLTCYRLEKPVRWCEGDLLEAWLNSALMLKTEPDATTAQVPVDDCEIELLHEPGSRRSWPILRQVYALLNSAHYRTRPSDLRMLMENPDLVLIVARLRQTVVGVTLLNREGGFDEALCEAVFLGRRRPRGHLLAQMLTAQAGVKGFAGYRGMRIQRIAVAGHCRRRGLGSRMIERAMRLGQESDCDYIGASFAVDAAASNFWRRAQFRLVHVSYAQGKSSGNHSIAVLRPTGDRMERALQQLQQRIQQQLPTWMTQFLNTMEAGQVTALLRYAGYQAAISEQERHEIEAFALGNRGFEICFASLQKYVMHRVAQSSFEPDSLLIEKAVQNREWKQLERESGSEGRKQLQQRLRELVDALRKDC